MRLLKTLFLTAALYCSTQAQVPATYVASEDHFNTFSTNIADDEARFLLFDSLTFTELDTVLEKMRDLYAQLDTVSNPIDSFLVREDILLLRPELYILDALGRDILPDISHVAYDTLYANNTIINDYTFFEEAYNMHGPIGLVMFGAHGDSLGASITRPDTSLKQIVSSEHVMNYLLGIPCQFLTSDPLFIFDTCHGKRYIDQGAIEQQFNAIVYTSPREGWVTIERIYIARYPQGDFKSGK